MLKKRQRKEMKFKPVYRNIFKDSYSERFNVTDHFLERWNERLDAERFNTKEELEEYLMKTFDPRDVEHLHSDHYLVCGNYVTATLEKNGIVFITTLGSYDDNPVLYNIISSGKLNHTIKKYGKLSLCS